MTTARALRGPFDYRLPEELRGGAVDVGSMLVVPFGRREVLGVVVGLAESSEVAAEKLLAPLRALELGVPAELVALAEWIALEYCSTIARALGLVLPPGGRTPAERAQAPRGRRRRAISRSARAARTPPSSRPTSRRRWARWPRRWLSVEPEQRLLHGVTGSGKTEVYLRAAAIALEQGRGAIVLVPEIALTPQIVGRFCERFGDTVAVLHSRLRPSRALRGVAAAARGRGARLRRPALGGVRADRGPRPDRRRRGARLLLQARGRPALRRPRRRRRARAARAGRCSCSAAPPRGRRASRRADASASAAPGGRAAAADVQVLDMRGQSHGLHPLTAQALAEVRARTRQGDRAAQPPRLVELPLLPLLRARVELPALRRRARPAPRRRLSRLPPLRPPRAARRRAAATAARRRWPATAPAPSASQHELAALLDDGGFPVFRLDADVVGAPRRPTRRERSCAASRRPSRGVLIGTQMVAKGHDFPDVTLGVVLDADATLRFPDFRAEERTFALIAQLAGRVGRGADGRVLVQTIAPEARAIVHAARHDSDGFLAGELERRRALGYPPFSHLIRIVCSAVDGRRARARRRAPCASVSRSACADADGAAGDARPCSARRRCFACAVASARCWS